MKLYALLFLWGLVSLVQSAPEDYEEPSLDEEEEIIVRSDGTSLADLPKLKPRPPFTLHDYSPKHAWITPLDENETFLSLLETAYQRAAVEFPDGEGRMKAEGLTTMWEYVLNPDFGSVTDSEISLIDSAVSSFKSTESLYDDSKPLNYGYLNKGAPYRALISLYHELREGRRESQGRRRMSSEDPSRDGLWEHEVGVDVPTQLPVGVRKRRTLIVEE
ncbi:hypothetical protein TrLO_g4629 [Triparma laevis f. longispina]|uniref:Uncharacterized protein n=1 Tax=Triparma laevis f. longispina TaxID=1714387 RepID=A0A9W7FB02_9STRA|nr:hypothetical protein TrLO_g4629 [Triparma laevis f. longispina]